MKFTQTKLKGAFIIDLDRKSDQRGFFGRTFCRDEFTAYGLKTMVAQCNLSYNHRQGTLRGMHYQTFPAAEAKLIRCIRGAIYDVIVDLRPDSSTYLQHIGVKLTDQNRRSLYVPPLFAHGYQALTDDAEVLYQVSEFYTPDCERGLRYDDPLLNLTWPLAVTDISQKDASWTYLTPQSQPLASPLLR